MKIVFGKVDQATKGALVLGVKEGRKLSPGGREIDKANKGLLKSAMESSRFEGKLHQNLTVFTKDRRVVLYGLGDGSDINNLWAENIGGGIYAALSRSGESEAAVVMDHSKGGDDDAYIEFAAHLGYGALLRSYSFDKYKTKQKPDDKASLAKISVLTGPYVKARRVFGELEKVAQGVFLTRDLVSEPPNVLYPESYAARCQEMKSLGVKVEVLGEARMKKLGMGALIGVGQGSERESKMVIMQWNGAAKTKKPIAFVGKGVTFDTGGISLKPAGGMEDMKWDMGGSGTVVGLMHALAARKAKVNVIGIVGLVENMPDGNAQRPGDIVTSMSGQTIEIINTDAEGRLVLADALWYCQDRFKPQFMLDLATLTGAMMVSLGQINCGYFANDDELSDKIAAAGKATGEGVWRMPLGEEYNKMMDSDVADMKNAGARFGGSITAACFLERFVNKVPWSHMDIAGMAWSSKDKHTVPKGGTGWGVRLLNQLVKDNYE